MSFFDYSGVKDYPIFLVECKEPSQNRLFREVINDYHSYVDFKHVPQRRINYLIFKTNGGDLIGAVGISSCVLALSDRDNFIGWSKEKRLSNSNMVGNNYRFCLIPDNDVENAGTMALKLLRTVGKERWESKYGDELVLLETYVQPEIDGEDYKKRNGAVYLADNWIKVGMTKGNSIKKAPLGLWKKEDSKRGEMARNEPEKAIKKYAVGNEHYVVAKSTKKIVFVKPLVRNWKSKLSK